MRSKLTNFQIIHLNHKNAYKKTLDVLLVDSWDEYTVTKGRNENKITYYNIPAAFDIETSSFYHNGEKCACMYIWQLGICGYNFTGRTWTDLTDCLQAVRDVFDLSPDKRLVIYDHNLSYEFQWIRKHLEWLQVFAIDTRKVAYAVTKDGFEFRCSYILTGKSLEMVGNDLKEIPCDKLHTLDYTQIRLPDVTEISPDEMDYCVNDIRVVQHLVFDKLMQDGSITKIPLTKTGYCRNFLKKKCLYGDRKTHKGETAAHFLKYTRLMGALTIDGYKEYRLLRDAYMGGFTHSNPKRTRKRIHERSGSIDYTSDYPFHMVAYPRYPMSKGEFVRPRKKSEFEHNIKYYACVFEIELHDVVATFYNDFYIPFSKCRCITGYQTSNGRVVSAKQLVITITEVDWEIISKTYQFDESKTKLGYFIRYRRGYLPKPIVEGILELYKDKTELKGLTSEDGSIEAYYQLRKELLNSCYGCIATDILRPEQIYDNGDWQEPKQPDVEKAIDKYNHKKDRILFYPWSLYVTALSRRSLWDGIIEFGDDYIYSDTDSIKATNIEKHQHYIKNYNRHCRILLKEAMKYHELPLELCHPKTQKGEEKWLGEWDFEGYYDEDGFKTLGCKRYMTLKDGKLSITVSGLNKKVCVPYLLEKYKTVSACFDAFDDDLTIPAGKTGKLTHTYIDDECSGYIKDYQGHRGHFEELSYIHLEDQEYSLSIAQTFKDFLYSIDKEGITHEF